MKRLLKVRLHITRFALFTKKYLTTLLTDHYHLSKISSNEKDRNNGKNDEGTSSSKDISIS